MKFNPQMLIQMMMYKNPQMYQQFQMFQQTFANNPQMKQQFETFKNNVANNPALQQQAMQEAMAKINGGGMSSAQPTINNSGAPTNNG